MPLIHKQWRIWEKYLKVEVWQQFFCGKRSSACQIADRYFRHLLGNVCYGCRFPILLSFIYLTLSAFDIVVGDCVLHFRPVLNRRTPTFYGAVLYKFSGEHRAQKTHYFLLIKYKNGKKICTSLNIQGF